MLNFIRGIVRPSLTWIGFISLVVFLLLKISIPDWYQVMVSTMVAFWFAGRMIGGGNGNGTNV